MKITDKITYTWEDNMELMKRYPDKYFDLVIDDPPYFSGPEKRDYYGSEVSTQRVKRKKYKSIEKSWKVPGKEYFDELHRVSKHQIIWGCNYYAQHIPAVGRIVWNKVNGNSSFSDCEIASCSLIDSVRMVKFMWNGMMQGCDFKGTMQGNKKLNEVRIHPTQKPVPLYKWQLDKFAKEGWKIADFHHGSGSLSIACHDLGFELVACELEENAYNDSVQRIINHISQLKLF